MSRDIHVKKGLDIKLKGEAKTEMVQTSRSSVYTLIPSDFHNKTPKMFLKEGEAVKAGQPVYYFKQDEKVQVVSPVSGKIQEIIRGEKRVILAIKILADAKDDFVNHGKQDPKSMSEDEVKNHLLLSGAFTLIKQRPYDVVAQSTDKPKAIFVTGIQSAPLAPDVDFVLGNKKQYLQTGFNALSKLTNGKVHLTISKKSQVFEGLQSVEKHIGSGKHPVGLVSTQIAKIDPINKGERVWVLNAFDVAVIGELFETGVFNQEKVIALTGTGFKNNAYTKAIAGASFSDITKNALNNGKYRLISGDVLTGLKSDTLRFYDYQITAIPEGDDYDFFGWNLPRPNKFSVYKAGMFSFLTPNKKYDLNTNTNGEHRGFVLTGEYEKVCPLDIYPMQLLKAILVKDIDNMEQMGIYEVAPEDFALTEYVCVSKQEHQNIVRVGLDLMMKEVG